MNRDRLRVLQQRDPAWPPLVTIVDGPRELPHVVLCPACDGDWCPSCRYTGLALPRPVGGAA